MGFIIKEIKIPDGSYKFISDEDEEGTVLKNLSKINIFVGENNSGKSRFLRSIISEGKMEYRPHNDDLENYNKFVADLKNKMTNFNHLKSFSETNKPIENADKINNIEFLVVGEDSKLPINNFLDSLKILDPNVSTGGHSFADWGSFMEKDLNNSFQKYFSHMESLEHLRLDNTFTKIYIPILRGLRPLNYSAKSENNQKPFRLDVYKKRTNDDYFNTSESGADKDNEDVFSVFSGLSTYDDIHTYSRSTYEKQELIKEFEEYLSENFFDKKKIKLTPGLDENGYEKDVITVKIGNERERPIYDLGDGIQSMIILILPLFLYKNENLLVFIEEPEYMLHPGLQRKLIDTFHDERFDNFQFFITTHSNHFLDVTLDYDDVSIFTLRKKLYESDKPEQDPKFFVEDLSYGDLNPLNLLGVRNSSVFLSNCTLWVEGITDRYYIKNYFDVYQNHLKELGNEEGISFTEFREDYHYSFVEYAGSNIVHWSFLEGLDKEEKMNVERLCGSIFLIADEDGKNKKIKRKEKLNENLGKRFFMLPCREIENLLKENVLTHVLKDYELGNSEIEDHNIFNEFDRERYKDKPLGEFIEDTILKENKRKYKSDSGSLNSNIKLDFCKKSVSHTNCLEDLSDDTIILCNCIYRFIAKKNNQDSVIDTYEQICEKDLIISDVLKKKSSSNDDS